MLHMSTSRPVPPSPGRRLGTAAGCLMAGVVIGLVGVFLMLFLLSRTTGALSGG